jgi:hypothetical protein
MDPLNMDYGKWVSFWILGLINAILTNDCYMGILIYNCLNNFSMKIYLIIKKDEVKMNEVI